MITRQAHPVTSQTSNDPTTLSYLAFNQLQAIYRSGGNAPDLVAKLNLAIGLIQEARIKRTQGDLADAANLEDNARTVIQSVLTAIPAAQMEAIHNSFDTQVTVVALIAATVISSTLLFYAFLRTWFYFEKMKLYEMRIVEKENKA